MTDAPGRRDAGEDEAARRAELDRVFNRRVVPLLPELGATQRKYRLIVSGILAIGLVLVGAGLGDVDDIGILMFGLLALGAGTIAFFGFNGLYRGKVRSTLLPVVCSAIGGIDYKGTSLPQVLSALRKIPLTRAFRNHDIDDAFSGEHDGTHFHMAEVKLYNRTTTTSGSGSKRTTTTRDNVVFKGLVFVIVTPGPIPQRILMRGPRRLGLPLLGGGWRRTDRQLVADGLSPVVVPDTAFASRFSLWADDPATALDVVGPGLAATLTRLAASAGVRGIDAALLEQHFVLLLPKRRDAFGAGSLLRPVARLRQEAHRLMDEVMVVHRLIGVLKGG